MNVRLLQLQRSTDSRRRDGKAHVPRGSEAEAQAAQAKTDLSHLTDQSLIEFTLPTAWPLY